MTWTIKQINNKNVADPSAAPAPCVPRTRASSATPPAPPPTGVRKTSLQLGGELGTVAARQDIFNRISTSSVK